LIRSALEVYKILSNSHNFPLIGKLTDTFTLSFGSMYEGTTHKLGSRVLGLVGLLQPPVPLFVQIFTRTVEKYYLMATTSPSVGN
jgi:hypothetical protein